MIVYSVQSEGEQIVKKVLWNKYCQHVVDLYVNYSIPQ